MTKIISILLLIISLHISSDSFSQKLITLKGDNIPLKEIFTKIEQQTGYSFTYTREVLKKGGSVNVHVQQKTVFEVLDILLKPKGLAYSYAGKNITVIIAAPLPMKAEYMFVKGWVKDVDGKPVAGVNVVVKGNKAGVVTDANGAFNIEADEQDVLIVSSVGYETKEVKIITGPLVVVLGKKVSEMQEVVVNKGYYTESKKLSTGSVGRIMSGEIEKQPVSNPLAAMYGRVPGITVTQTTGVPGGGFNIQIRGENSLRRLNNTNGNIPLYIIDGVPFSPIPINTIASRNIYPTGVDGSNEGLIGASPFSSINPADIESIDILKDADATSIYGSRGANGVVLITTKKGKEGKMQMSLNAYTGMGKITRMLDMLNTQEYLEMRKEAYKNDGVSIYPANAYDVNGTWDQNKYTNWQKVLIGGTARQTDAQIELSGGTKGLIYRFGGGYHKETTVFPGNFGDKRGSAFINLSNTSLNSKFRSNISANYSVVNSNLLIQDLTSIALTYAPNAPDLLDSTGKLNWPAGVTQNPMRFTRQPYDAITNTLISSANLSYTIIPGLILRTVLGYSTVTRKEISKIPISAQNPLLNNNNSSRFGNSNVNVWSVEPQLEWQVRLQDHRLSFLIGSTINQQKFSSLSQSASGFTSEALMNNISAVPPANVSTTFNAAEYLYNAIYGRINYTYKTKYILNLTGRRDGSSRFGPGKQFGNFGAVGAAWCFSEEEFMKNANKIFSFGKLRGSYGTTGNDKIVDYQFLDLYAPSNSYDGLIGLGPQQLLNPDFSWEYNKKMEIALELGFLNDRINFTTAWYRNRSSNQLVSYALPPTTGFPSIQYNLDATVQNTGLEIELNAQILKTRKIKWTASFNISFPKSKLVAYPNLAGSSNASRYVVGQPLQIVKLYRFLGVNPLTGLYLVRDVDHNGAFNSNDQTTVKFIGPKLAGGISNHLEWKNFQFDLLLQFVQQNGRNYIGLTSSAPGTNNINFPKDVMDRWQKPGDNSMIQKFTANQLGLDYFRFYSSDAYITDASFLRLKNIYLGYAIPVNTLEKAHIKGLRIFLQGQNLITLTNYKGLDPESQGTSLPPLKFITAGIQLTL